MREFESLIKSDDWFPPYARNASHAFIHDQLYEDFDQQAERLCGHDQTYTQLTPGAFSGRFLSCDLGRSVSLHIEQANQALEQDVVSGASVVSFGVVLQPEAMFLANGRTISSSDVLVLPADCHLHLCSPSNGAILAVVVDRAFLLSQAGLDPRFAEWLAALGSGIGYLTLPDLARRLREDARDAIEAMNQNLPHESAFVELVGQAFISSLVGKLSLGFGALPPVTLAESPIFQHFRESRDTLLSIGCTARKAEAATRLPAHFDRRDHRAFSSTLGIPPMAYFRIARLHKVRRCLLSLSNADHSIGDLAAKYGFWDWSRFTHHYKLQFGELPSKTRLRAAD